MEGTHFYWSEPAARLVVTGPDAAVFLQGQFTNDLRGAAGAATYGLWLNHKGRVLADSFVFRRGADVFEIVSVSSPAATIGQRLESFIIADDVSVADHTVGSRLLTLGGEGASRVFERFGGPAPVRGEFRETVAGAPVFRGRAAGRNPCWHVLLEDADTGPARAELEQVLNGLDATEVCPSIFEKQRIAGGIPAVPADLGPGDLPQEGGLEHEAISFNKGCYLGQEVMARIHSMGRVRRRLFVVRAAEVAERAELVAGTELFREGKKLGDIRSGVSGPDGWTGLAMLGAQGLGGGERLATSAGPGIEVVSLAEGRAW